MIDYDDVDGSKGRSCPIKQADGIIFLRKVRLKRLNLILSVFGKDRLQGRHVRIVVRGDLGTLP